APNTPQTLTFSLIVTDTQNAVTGNGTNGNTSTASTVNVNTSDYAAPVASAGSDQSVHTADPVQLDASGSSQADGHTLSYSWSQTQRPSVSLSSTTAQQPTFTAPNAGTTLKFTVTVTDTQNSITPNVTTSSDVTDTGTDSPEPRAQP